MSELKPCPFCGGVPAVIGITATNERSVICYSCGGETAHKATQDEAIAAWNRRTHPQPVTPAGGEVSKRWPFVESPGEFVVRLEDAMREFPLIGAVRHVLIENPATLSHPPVADAALDVDALIASMDKLADYAGVLHHDCPVVTLATVRHVLDAALNQRGGG